MNPRLAITLGDPAGIGPEVILKALAGLQLEAAEITVIGSRTVLEQTYDRLCKGSTAALIQPNQLAILDPEPTSPILPGVATETTGRLSFTYLQQAIALTLAGQFDGIVTGPIAKSAWKQAGHHYPGQTELLAEMAGSQRYGMLFVARSPHTGWTLRTLLATTHIPLAQVATTLTPALMALKLDLLIESLDQDFGISQPRIVVAGLNPHSGEQGQLGREEQDWLIPWLTQERVRRPDIELLGPIPPDTLWVQPGQGWFGVQDQSKFSAPTLADAYLALYHDQGLIPLKLMAFDRAVNTTIGLPFVRTSPDHGTAFDIAGKGLADPSSMKAALTLALSLIRHRMKAS